MPNPHSNNEALKPTITQSAIDVDRVIAAALDAANRLANDDCQVGGDEVGDLLSSLQNAKALRLTERGNNVDEGSDKIDPQLQVILDKLEAAERAHKKYKQQIGNKMLDDLKAQFIKDCDGFDIVYDCLNANENLYRLILQITIPADLRSKIDQIEDPRVALQVLTDHQKEMDIAAADEMIDLL